MTLKERERVEALVIRLLNEDPLLVLIPTLHFIINNIQYDNGNVILQQLKNSINKRK